MPGSNSTKNLGKGRSPVVFFGEAFESLASDGFMTVKEEGSGNDRKRTTELTDSGRALAKALHGLRFALPPSGIIKFNLNVEVIGMLARLYRFKGVAAEERSFAVMKSLLDGPAKAKKYVEKLRDMGLVEAKARGPIKADTVLRLTAKGIEFCEEYLSPHTNYFKKALASVKPVIS